ncbi:hypothetical protein [Bradyrhizobium barranii]
MTTVALRWVHRNLFAKPFDVALSLVVIPVLAWAVYAFAYWALVQAHWQVVGGSFKVLMTGIYPADQLWRAWFSVATLCAMFGAGLGLSVRPGRAVMTVVASVAILIATAMAAAIDMHSGMLTAASAALGIVAWIAPIVRLWTNASCYQDSLRAWSRSSSCSRRRASRSGVVCCSASS